MHRKPLHSLGDTLAIGWIALAASCAAAPAAPPPVEVVQVTPVVLPVASAPPVMVEQVATRELLPVEMFVMSQCPYSAQMIGDFQEVVQRLGADIDLRVSYVGTLGEKGELKSMHGPTEVAGNISEVCAIKHARNWFPVLVCQFDDIKNVETNWEACGLQAGAPVARISSCVQSGEGSSLLQASYARSTEKGIQGTPTLLIAGEKYTGARRPRAFMQAICNAFPGDRPGACADLPEAVAVNVTLLSDERCTECSPTRFESQIVAKLGKPVVKKLDYSSPEGQRLFKSIEPAMLPAAVFDATLDADKEASAAFGKLLTDRSGGRVFNGSAWNPVCADPGGCSRSECKATLLCRTEQPKHLDVYLMSRCPFAAKGMMAMGEVLENFEKSGEKIDFSIHVIGDGDKKAGFKAMHGPAEVEENLRYVCAIKHYAAKHRFLSYIGCRSQDTRDADWQKCTGGTTGISADVIRKCSEGDEGKGLLEASQAASKAAGMTASPTWLVSNRFKHSGIDAETIKTHVCAHNKLKGCDHTLSGPPPRKP